MINMSAMRDELSKIAEESKENKWKTLAAMTLGAGLGSGAAGLTRVGIEKLFGPRGKYPHAINLPKSSRTAIRFGAPAALLGLAAAANQKARQAAKQEYK